MQAIEWCHFRWPWVTPDPGFKVTVVLKGVISSVSALFLAMPALKAISVKYYEWGDVLRHFGARIYCTWAKSAVVLFPYSIQNLFQDYATGFARNTEALNMQTYRRKVSGQPAVSAMVKLFELWSPWIWKVYVLTKHFYVADRFKLWCVLLFTVPLGQVLGNLSVSVSCRKFGTTTSRFSAQRPRLNSKVFVLIAVIISVDERGHVFGSVRLFLCLFVCPLQRKLLNGLWRNFSIFGWIGVTKVPRD